MPKVVLVLPKSGYRNEDFLAAAGRLGVEVIAASDVCHQLADIWEETPVALRFRDAESAAEELARGVRERSPVAVLGVDDLTALVAALAAEKLGLPHNPPEAVAAARNKALSREKLRAAGVPVPRFELVPTELAGAELEGLLERAPYPCVVKPLVLSGSRGVIRADNRDQLRAALARVAALLRSPEVALEGLLVSGRLHVLALFDKPDPLDGPYFEETLYVTPSRHPAALQDAVAREVSRGSAALGLREGPVHAELRLSPAGPRILEVAARSIGGLCGRALRFGVGMTLEELILRHALGVGTEPPPREKQAAGVLMLPIRKRGVLEEVRGVEEARRVPLIEDVAITAHLREELVPLPEGASYLGFAFARGATPAGAHGWLRQPGAAPHRGGGDAETSARPGRYLNSANLAGGGFRSTE